MGGCESCVHRDGAEPRDGDEPNYEPLLSARPRYPDPEPEPAPATPRSTAVAAPQSRESVKPGGGATVLSQTIEDMQGRLGVTALSQAIEDMQSRLEQQSQDDRSIQPGDVAALSQAIEDMQSRMEQQSQDSLEQKLTIRNLRSEIGRLRRSIAERDCEVEWARMDALELHYRALEGARSRADSGEAWVAPDQGKFEAPDQDTDQDTDAVEHQSPSSRPEVFEAFLTPPLSPTLTTREPH